MKKNIIITGRPAVGKTTLMKKLAEGLKGAHPAGFYTEEIKEGGERKGFSLNGLDGTRSTLAHVDVHGSHRVGKYGVDVGAFESFLGALGLERTPAEIILIDEIGKMECFSGPFTETVRRLLDSDKTVIATVADSGGGFIAEVKGRSDVEVYTLSTGNRDTVARGLVAELGA